MLSRNEKKEKMKAFFKLFLLKPSSEEPGGGCKCEKADECHRPQVVEDDIGRGVFEESAFSDNEIVA